jgi:thiamine-monophosphate kinase
LTSERRIVEWIAGQAPAVGDDCAVLPCAPWGTLLVTVDSVIDGVHLHWDEHGPGAFGYKAVARGLSDVAAMGGEPLWAVVAACFPRGATLEDAQALHAGAARAGCELVGGDTAFGPTAYVAATVLGRAHPERGPVLRSGARVGDWIVVTGPLGGSLASGRHFRFTPRVAEARALVETCDVGAMIDVSDGLSTDLLHILDASNVGCRLEAARVPCDDFEAALNDGEDHELLATVKPGDLPPGVVRIGEIVPGDARIVHADGREEPLVAGGYEHGA